MRVLLLIALFGCTPPPARESVVLRIAVGGPLGELAPTGSESGLSSIAQPWVYDKLVTVDPSGNLKPVLAARVERLSTEQMRAELRPDATFSDGAQVTEGDVIRSLEAGGLVNVALSQGAFVVRSRQPGLPVDALLLQAYVFRESQGRVLGSGPFTVASQSQSELRLTRRTPQAGRVNEVRLIAYKTPRDAFAHTLKGDANLIIDIEPRSVEFFRDVPSLQIIHGAGRSTDAIIFSPTLSRADRVQLSEVLASSQLRELAYGSGECAEGASAPRNDRSAMMTRSVLRILSWGPFERLALATRRILATRGGEILHVSPQDAISRVASGAFDIVTARPLRWPPSSMALVWRTDGPYNIYGYSNRTVDRALDASDWAAAEAALRDDPPAALVCTHEQTAVVDARIINPRLGPYETLETLPDWEVAR
ncbi:MAG: hypothetical protein E6J65_27130 [Deltaproteobacteria bacterium]|nr:MAG: hypothetical protein E6J65_27130 [Deltaproteobacteria bacterium]